MRLRSDEAGAQGIDLSACYTASGRYQSGAVDRDRDAARAERVFELPEPPGKRRVAVGAAAFGSDAVVPMRYKSRRISAEEALRNADSHTDLQLRIKLSRGVSPDTVRLSIVPGANLHSRK